MKRVAGVVAVAAMLLIGGAVRAQQQPTSLTPEIPKDGASVNVRPKFVVRADSPDVSKLRFRIELSRDDFKTIAYTFDQLKEANGWAFLENEGETPGALYFPSKRIAGGDYTWRVSSWDGLSWKVSDTTFRLNIDDVPPAEVTDVRMYRNPQTGCMHISWDPVVTDVKGNPERVARYHVFRYWKRSSVPSLGPFEAGTTPGTEFDDCNADTLKRPMVFYRVEAEDEAGNIFGRRRW